MDIISPVIGAIVEYTIESIGRQLSYLFFFRKNIQNLKIRVEMLKNTKESVLHKVNEARRNAENIESSVQNWLNEVDDIIDKSETILANQAQQGGLCLNLVQRHQLSRRAVKLGDEVVEIKNEGNFDRVSYRVALSEVESSKARTSDFVNFVSRKPIIDKIFGALMDDNVSRIGVYEMGGVGKTMLVKEISRIVMEKKLFDEVVTSTISQTLDIKTIQGQLGDKLGLKFDQETNEGRALMLHKRLKMEQRILIVLDDVWKQIDLETIGIPSIEDHRGCKILFTSRDNSVLLNDMCIDKNFEIGVLQEDETWNLFKKMAGEIVETSYLKSIAVEIARECAHLPIAIITIAKALRNKHSSIWKDALNQLRNPVVVNIKGMNEKVYSSLKLSYDQLDCEEAKLLFLLCSMFPEDAVIDVKKLHVYAIGLGFLHGVDTMAQAQHRIAKLVDDLISSSLLIEDSNDGWGHRYVKMHDLIRDVAILIASKDDRICTLSYSKGLDELWLEKIMSGNHTVVYLNVEGLCNIPQKLKLPKVQLLVLRGSLLDGCLLSNTFFVQSKELKILELINMNFSIETTPLLFPFANLQTLCLFRCKLGNMEAIGDLNRLEFLSFKGSNIIEIPTTISQLTRLKVLDLSICLKLKIIPPNILSNLKNLEELYLDRFDGWEREELNDGRRNASLSEISHLSHLCVLVLWIQDEKIMPKQLFSRLLNLEKFVISIGCGALGHWSMNISRVLCLKMETGSDLDNEINVLLKRSEELHLVGSVGARVLPFELKENQSLDLKKLYIYDNLEFKNLAPKQKDHFQKFWSKLEYLKLSKLENLESIFHSDHDHVRESQFNKLKVIKLLDCNKLGSLFFDSILDDFLHLEEIKIVDCKMMTAIAIMKTERAIDKIEFVNLKILTVEGLPRIQSFLSKTEKQEQSCTLSNGDSFFNELNLTELNVSSCGILNMSMSSSMSFRNLRSLMVEKCHKLTYLLHPSVARSMVQLIDLVVNDCKRMTTVIARGVEEENDEILFKSLCHISLEDLPKLTSFHHGKCTIKFPILNSIILEDCPEMRDFSLGIVSTPCLSMERIGSCDFGILEFHPILKDSKDIIVEDINITIRQVWDNHYDTNLPYLFEQENLEDENQPDPSSYVEE
ncbi:disease resistance protein At4g27190-like isoform X2 [Benincasa hispida]|uniref:disease resistance protein At4g27190-like isoform X2 n=1 Tax=Benincasa hispida TaxID=102211 RepID=UPI001901A351|nr:disease resistance protein At4g27190-like isoform X2 [Benincasa hispida]